MLKQEFLKDKFCFKDGIWYSKTTCDKIYYDKDGNKGSFLNEQNSFWFKHRNEIILNGIEKNVNKKDFYDIGGGNGIVSKYLQDKNYDVTLIEPGTTAVSNAKKEV